MKTNKVTLYLILLLPAVLTVLFTASVAVCFQSDVLLIAGNDIKNTPAESADETVLVNLDTLSQIPKRRFQAALLKKPTEKDSSADIIRKEKKYFETLKSIVSQLKKTYYFHNEFPADIFQGIDKYSLVLTGIQYPFYPTTGSTRYDGILIETRIKLCEDLIVEMAKSIFRASSEPGITINGNEKPTYENWIKEWNHQQ